MVREKSLHCRDAAVKKGQLKRHGLKYKRIITQSGMLEMFNILHGTNGKIEFVNIYSLP